MKNLLHIILGFDGEKRGASIHPLDFFKNLRKRNIEAKYYSTWFNSSIKERTLETSERTPISLNLFKKQMGIFYLQTHTWEYNGFLKEIEKNQDSLIFYNLHAIIPYYYLREDEKKLFLEGKLSEKALEDVIEKKMSRRERSQLDAMKRSDVLLTLCESHKNVLKSLGLNKPIGVLENVSEFYGEDLTKERKDAEEFKDRMNKKNVLLYCGLLSPKKGSFGLFDSFRRIVQEEPSSLLILLGSGEEDKKNLLQYGLSEELSKKILFVPWRNKTRGKERKNFLNYYLASDVLIQPILTNELYSKSVIDAMTLGIPTITCKSPYTIGSSENSDAIFDSFVYMKDHKEETLKIVNSAREKIKKENNWDAYFSKLEQLENRAYALKFGS